MEEKGLGSTVRGEASVLEKGQIDLSEMTGQNSNYGYLKNSSKEKKGRSKKKTQGEDMERTHEIVSGRGRGSAGA